MGFHIIGVEPLVPTTSEAAKVTTTNVMTEISILQIIVISHSVSYTVNPLIYGHSRKCK